MYTHCTLYSVQCTGQWCGHFGLEHAHRTPELFLYSKKDFYLPYKYMEEVVLASRKNREFKVVYCIL